MAKRSIEALVAEAADAKATPEDAALIRSLLDLTSLKGADGDETPEEVEALCRDALGAGVAAVCLFPKHLPRARDLLEGSGVKLATVAAFPQGGDDVALAADETAAAVAEGADEVDVVAPLEALQDGDVGMVGELVEACRTAGGPNTTLKLILETGVLQRPDLITAAARSAVMGGVNFLKTSTGKVEMGATLEAAAYLLAVIEEANGRVGLKLSGGVRTADQAAGYLHLARTVMGEGWVTPERLRFGASSLLADLRRVEAGG